MKGDTNIEFILSVGTFLIIIAFLSFHILSFAPTFHLHSVSNIIQCKSFQVSEMLIMNEGSPSNWNTKGMSEVNKIGLTTGEEYVLNKNKITKLQNWCDTNYRNVTDLLNIDYRMSVIINMTDIDENSIMLCAPSGVDYGRKQWIYRFAIVDENGNGISDKNDKIAKIKIAVF